MLLRRWCALVRLKVPTLGLVVALVIALTGPLILETAAPAAASISGNFVPITINNGCSLAPGFSVSGPSTCGVNAQTNGQRYICLTSVSFESSPTEC